MSEQKLFESLDGVLAKLSTIDEQRDSAVTEARQLWEAVRGARQAAWESAKHELRTFETGFMVRINDLEKEKAVFLKELETLQAEWNDHVYANNQDAVAKLDKAIMDTRVKLGRMEQQIRIVGEWPKRESEKLQELRAAVGQAKDKLLDWHGDECGEKVSAREQARSAYCRAVENQFSAQRNGFDFYRSAKFNAGYPASFDAGRWEDYDISSDGLAKNMKIPRL